MAEFTRNPAPKLVSLVLTLLLLLSPAPPRWTADAAGAWLTAFGVSSQTQMEPPSIQIGNNHYGIIFWCTPVPLWTCMFLVFGFTKQTIGRFAAFSICAASLFALLVPFQVALAIYLHQKGLRWSFAHYPAYALLHFAGVIAIMGVAKPATRNGKAAQPNPPN